MKNARETDDNDTSDINFFTESFHGQIIIQTGDYQELSFASILKLPDAYLKPSQAFKTML